MEEWGDRYARLRKYQDLIDKASEKGNFDAAKIYMDERDRQPPGPFGGVEVCRVVRVASDYIELEPLYQQEGTIVISLNKLVRIQFPRNQEGK
jgi:hypothetical protein